MQVRRYVWVIWFFLGALLSACAGGSGSSGFDNFPSSENAAIQTALDEQRCVSFRRLNICPADTTAALPTTATPTPTPTPSATPTSIPLFPTPQTTATATPTRRATATPPPTASPTPTPTLSAPRVDTGISDGVVACALADSGCSIVLPFAPEGFSLGTVFRVAVRTLDPPSAWTIGPDPTPSGSPEAPAFDAAVPVKASANAPGTTQRAQLAVLAFLKPPTSVPTTVDILDDSGADYAFVSDELTLVPAALEAP